MTRIKNTHIEKILCIIKWFTSSEEECEYHRRLQFSLDKSNTVLFWAVHK